MPGVKEGWPKVIAEAWAHGAVPVAAAAGLVPWIMEGKQAARPSRPTPDGLADPSAAALRPGAAPADEQTVGPGLAAELSLDTFRARLEEVSRCGLPARRALPSRSRW